MYLLKYLNYDRVIKHNLFRRTVLDIEIFWGDHTRKYSGVTPSCIWGSLLAMLGGPYKAED